MHKLKAAVVGAGYLGTFHAEKLAMLPGCELVAVVDIDADTSHRVAGKHGVEALTDHRPLLGRVDAVSIAVPTRHHHVVARDFLRHDTHVLLEKPISATLTEAQELIEQNISLLSAIDLGRFVTSPSFWGGLIVCGLMAAAAIYVRRYRDES